MTSRTPHRRRHSSPGWIVALAMLVALTAGAAMPIDALGVESSSSPTETTPPAGTGSRSDAPSGLAGTVAWHGTAPRDVSEKHLATATAVRLPVADARSASASSFRQVAAASPARTPLFLKHCAFLC